MKKLTILFAVCSGLLLASCGGKKVENTPEAVAKAFMGQIQKLDFAGAKKYATKESGSVLDMMEMTTKMAKNMGKEASKDADMEKMKNAKVEFGAAKIEGDEATMSVTTDGKAKDIKLKKEDGAWKVAFDKSAMNKGGMGDTDKAKEDMEKIGDMSDTLSNKMNTTTEDLNKAMEKLNDPKFKESMDKLKEAAEKMKELEKNN